MEANSCLQENMINDSCSIFHSYKQKLPLTQIMFNYDTESIRSSTIVALVLYLATHSMTNTIAMNDGYFLAHNSEITAPIRFKF